MPWGNAYKGRGGLRRRELSAGVGAVFAGLAATASVTLLAGGMQAATVPSAAASTTTHATPWLVQPFLPPFLPNASSQVSSQGTLKSSQGSSAVQDWVDKALPAAQDIQTAVQSLQSAYQAGDIAGAKAACLQMSDANQRLNTRLPTPVVALTSEVRGVVDEIDTASSVCLAAGPNAGQPEIDSITSHLNLAMAHFNKAKEIVAGG